MAWTPKQISAYEEMLKRYKKLRQQVIKVHKHFEEVTPTGRLPSLVVPKKIRKMSQRQMRMSGRKMYQMRMRELRKYVGKDIFGQYMKDYKRTYMELWRSYLIKEDPEGRFGRFTEEQIKLASINEPETARLMELYNSTNQLSAEQFFLALKSGKIPSFAKLYNEAVGDFEVEEKFLSGLSQGLKWARRVRTSEARGILQGASRPKKPSVRGTHMSIQKGKKTIAGRK